MAQKDVLAASKTMLRAIEARRLTFGPDHRAVAESVKGLAAIYRASGRCARNVAELLEKDLRFLTKENRKEILAPGDLRPFTASRRHCSLYVPCDCCL